MDSETNLPETTAAESKQESILRNEIVKNLAESLVQFDGLLQLSNELDRKGYPNQLKAEMSKEDAEKALLMLVENHPNLLNSDVPLKEITIEPPHEQGVWALETFMSNLSNEDSS
jgi:hypothetical protein